MQVTESRLKEFKKIPEIENESVGSHRISVDIPFAILKMSVPTILVRRIREVRR